MFTPKAHQLSRGIITPRATGPRHCVNGTEGMRWPCEAEQFAFFKKQPVLYDSSDLNLFAHNAEDFPAICMLQIGNTTVPEINSVCGARQGHS